MMAAMAYDVLARVCHKNVRIPTVVVKPSPYGDEDVFIQWHGLGNGRDLGSKQFQFRVSFGPYDRDWEGRLQDWQVAYLGPTADRPEFEGFACSVEVEKSAWMVWLVNQKVLRRPASEIGEESFLPQDRTLPLLLDEPDPVYGLITPRRYKNPEVFQVDETWAFKKPRWPILAQHLQRYLGFLFP